MSKKHCLKEGTWERPTSFLLFPFTPFSSVFVLHFLSRLLIKSKAFIQIVYLIHIVCIQSCINVLAILFFYFIQPSTVFSGTDKLFSTFHVTLVTRVQHCLFRQNFEPHLMKSFDRGQGHQQDVAFYSVPFSERYFYSCTFLFTLDFFFNGSDFLFSRTFFSLSTIVVFNVSSMPFWDIILV